jgi:hypothetical protein
MQRWIVFWLCLLLAAAPVQAQTKPFILPVALPPGANSWLLGQPYGNTLGAYLRGDEWYSAGQRLHFGVDLSMPCGTPLVAIGDGEVIAVSDLSFGSAPHNLLIRHDAGYVSLYGHLLERPQLAPGMRVSVGQEIARSGDPDLTCRSRPHLHLEIRSLDFRTAYNPTALINADWHALALIGPFRFPLFQQNLRDARRWMTQEDQPDVQFGGAALNNYEQTFPTLDMIFAAPNAVIASATADTMPESWSLRRVGFDGCCANAFWHPTDSARLYLIDGVVGNEASVFEWDVTLGAPTGVVSDAPPPLQSPDGAFTLRMEGEMAVITQVADGFSWTVNSGGAVPSLSSDNRWLLMARTSEIVLPNETAPPTTVWVTERDGSGGRVLAETQGLSAQWLDAERILITQRSEATTTLYVVNALTAEAYTLYTAEFLRGLSISPGGGRLMFYLAYQQQPTTSGIYSLETQIGATAQALPWFGGWRWRSADHVVYVPFTPDAPQQLREYHLLTGVDIALTDGSTPFVISDGAWTISPDGSRIAFWNALDQTTWIAEAAE